MQYIAGVRTKNLMTALVTIGEAPTDEEAKMEVQKTVDVLNTVNECFGGVAYRLVSLYAVDHEVEIS